MEEKRVPMDGKVRAWLDKQGFPLEMRVAKAMRKAGLFVTQSDYYQEEEKGRHREIDVVASAVEQRDRRAFHSVLTIECKASPGGRPWVLFSGPSLQYELAWALRSIGTALGQALLFTLRDEAEVSDLPLFHREPTAGYGLAVAMVEDEAQKGRGTPEKDVAFRALESAASAAVGVCQRMEKLHQALGADCLAFPVVVLEAPLYEASLDDEDAVVLRPIDWGVILWRHPIGRHTEFCVNVVTESGLAEWLPTRVDAMRALAKKMMEDRPARPGRG